MDMLLYPLLMLIAVIIFMGFLKKNLNGQPWQPFNHGTNHGTGMHGNHGQPWDRHAFFNPDLYLCLASNKDVEEER